MVQRQHQLFPGSFPSSYRYFFEIHSRGLIPHLPLSGYCSVLSSFFHCQNLPLEAANIYIEWRISGKGSSSMAKIAVHRKTVVTNKENFCEVQVTIHQVCTFAALTVKENNRLKSQNPIVAAGSTDGFLVLLNYEGAESLRIHVKRSRKPASETGYPIFGWPFVLFNF